MFFMEKKVYKNRIRVMLADKMVTKTHLAELLGVSKMTISRWCTNTTQPSAPQLIENSQVLQCDLKDLYETIE
jgi:DNA-binding XRE family transcriptional regulator